MCYCGKTLKFEQCCKPIIAGEKSADTAEQLMRSRYSAYCVKECGYIHNTYTNELKAANSEHEISVFAELAVFIGLTVYQHQHDEESATVHFKAEYLCDGFLCQLEEISDFIIEAGQWRYNNGTIIPHPEVKLGRNDVCPCGSNKKFKKCHG